MELCWVSHPCEMVSGQATVTTPPPPSSRGHQPLLHTVLWKPQPVDSAQGWTLVNPLCPGLRPLTGPGSDCPGLLCASGPGSDCPGLLCASGTRSPGLPPDRAGQFHTGVTHDFVCSYFLLSPALGLSWARPEASRVAGAAAVTHAGVALPGKTEHTGQGLARSHFLTLDGEMAARNIHRTKGD